MSTSIINRALRVVKEELAEYLPGIKTALALMGKQYHAQIEVILSLVVCVVVYPGADKFVRAAASMRDFGIADSDTGDLGSPIVVLLHLVDDRQALFRVFPEVEPFLYEQDSLSELKVIAYLPGHTTVLMLDVSDSRVLN